jgi:hypothetical protein
MRKKMGNEEDLDHELDPRFKRVIVDARHVVQAEPGTVTVNLVTQISTSANASFDKYVNDFTKRISRKADELFGLPSPERTLIPKGE